jgi:hypothetical protein
MVQDSKGTFTGPEIAFIYPDLETAFVGTFEDSRMVEGRSSKIVGAELRDGILVRKLTCEMLTCPRMNLNHEPLKPRTVVKTQTHFGRTWTLA